MISTGIGLGLQFCKGSSSNYDEDSLAFFSRASVTSRQVKQRHDLMVRWLKAEGLWGSLYLWHEADAGAMHDIADPTPASNNETVTAWLNRKTDQGTWLQETANQMPLYHDAGIFGKPSLKFSTGGMGASDNYTLLATDNLDSATVFSTFVDDDHDALTNIHFIYVWQYTGGRHKLALVTWHPSSSAGYASARRVNADAITTINPASPLTAPTVAVHEVNYFGGSENLWINGNELGPLSLPSSGKSDASAMDMNNTGIGGLAPSHTTNGRIGGIMLFRDVILTPAQKSYVQNHLTS